jgi:chromosome partitioning protein
MRVVVAASRKGGVGKTNFCVQVGVAAEHAGIPTAFVDLDPMAGLSKWWKRRSADTPLLVRADPDLATALEHLRSLDIGLVVIDTPPAVSQIVADAVGLADLVVVPIQASPDDLDGVEGTLELLSASNTRSVFVLSRVKSRASMTLDVITALSHHGAVCPAMLYDREDYKVSKIRGQSVAEFKPSSGAADDVAALWAHIAQYAEVRAGDGGTTYSDGVGSTGIERGAGSTRACSASEQPSCPAAGGATERPAVSATISDRPVARARSGRRPTRPLSA